MANKNLTYLDALERIGQIVQKLESEELDVDTLAADVKEATELINYCRGKLRKTEEEVKKIFDNEQK